MEGGASQCDAEVAKLQQEMGGIPYAEMPIVGWYRDPADGVTNGWDMCGKVSQRHGAHFRALTTFALARQHLRKGYFDVVRPANRGQVSNVFWGNALADRNLCEFERRNNRPELFCVFVVV